MSSPAAAGPPPVTIHAAHRIPGPDGMVERGVVLTEDEAVLWLQGGGDIVACDGGHRANKDAARRIMIAAFGGYLEDAFHGGRMSLPHFHPPARKPPDIHAFFEPTGRHARRTKS